MPTTRTDNPEIVVYQLHADYQSGAEIPHIEIRTAATARQLARALMAAADEARPGGGG